MTREELAGKIEEEVKGLSTYLDPAHYLNACDDAIRETGFSFPISTDFQIRWAKERAKRHLFFYLYTESAHKFKYEQINLQQRFEHYRSIIGAMDRAYDKAKEEFWTDFAGVSDVNRFGTLMRAGFQYDNKGRDTTYDSTNKVNIHPTEND